MAASLLKLVTNALTCWWPPAPPRHVLLSLFAPSLSPSLSVSRIIGSFFEPRYQEAVLRQSGEGVEGSATALRLGKAIEDTFLVEDCPGEVREKRGSGWGRGGNLLGCHPRAVFVFANSI